MEIFTAVLAIAIFAIMIGYGLWKLFTSTGLWKKSTATPPAGGTAKVKRSIPWGVIKVAVFLILVAMLFQHSSREWLMENVEKLVQTQIVGEIHIPYDLERLGLSATISKLPPGSWVYKGVLAGTPQYPFSEKKGEKPFQTGYFNCYGRQSKPQDVVSVLPIKKGDCYGALLIKTPHGGWRAPGDSLLGNEPLEVRANVEPGKLSWYPLNITSGKINLVFEKMP
ncbi:MAG: hypothetical protein EOM19_05180 [Candidatus Moranbacteria bacterium]|nr:hypothetical protein [Candidatus Moranbacteria bacterium]